MKAIVTSSLIFSLPFLPLAGSPLAESDHVIEEVTTQEIPAAEQSDATIAAESAPIEPTGRELFEPEPDDEMELIEAEGEFDVDELEETPREVGSMTFDPYASQRKRQTRNLLLAAGAAVVAAIAIAFAPNNSDKNVPPGYGENNK